jgi:hypothetical protein
MRRADEIREQHRQALLDVRTHLGSDWRAVEFRDDAVNWALFRPLPGLPDDAPRSPHNFSNISASAQTICGHAPPRNPIRYVPPFGPGRWGRLARWRFSKGAAATPCFRGRR